VLRKDFAKCASPQVFSLDDCSILKFRASHFDFLLSKKINIPPYVLTVYYRWKGEKYNLNILKSHSTKQEGAFPTTKDSPLLMPQIQTEYG
jgi:hypothetical protein